MAQTLQEFVNELRRELDLFQSWWSRMHDAFPDEYPLRVEDDDEGMWLEHFFSTVGEELPTVEEMAKMLGKDAPDNCNRSRGSELCDDPNSGRTESVGDTDE